MRHRKARRRAARRPSVRGPDLLGVAGSEAPNGASKGYLTKALDHSAVPVGNESIAGHGSARARDQNQSEANNQTTYYERRFVEHTDRLSGISSTPTAHVGKSQ
jgi:hypothetical protein